MSHQSWFIFERLNKKMNLFIYNVQRCSTIYPCWFTTTRRRIPVFFSNYINQCKVQFSIAMRIFLVMEPTKELFGMYYMADVNKNHTFIVWFKAHHTWPQLLTFTTYSKCVRNKPRKNDPSSYIFEIYPPVSR